MLQLTFDGLKKAFLGKVLVAPILASLLAYPLSLSGDDCVKWMSAVTIHGEKLPPSEDAVFDYISTLVKEGFQGLPESRNFWLSYPRQQPRTQNFVELLIELNPDQRKSLSKLVALHPPKDERLLFIIQLALYDQVAWQKYFDRLIEDPLLNDALVNSLIPVLRSMPSEMKEQFLSQIRELYPTLSKKNFTWIPPRKNLRLAPKRSVDAFLNHILKTDEVVLNALASGRSPKEALQVLFDTLQANVFASTSYGQYQASDVLNIARIFQEGLKTLPQQLGVSPEIIIVGSLPNGRSNLGTSDIDTQINHKEILKLYPSLKKKLREYFTDRGQESVDLNPTVMRSTTTLHFAAQINPVQIRITQKSIELLVFPPFSPLHADKVISTFNYAQPTRILVEGVGSVDTGYMVGSWQAPQLDQAAKKHKLLSEFSNEFTPVFLDGLLNHSPKAWSQYLDRLFSKPVEDDALLSLLVPVMESMPVETRDLLLSKISTRYNTLSKEKKERPFPWFKTVYRRLAPKRSIDVVLSHLNHPLKTFESVTAHGGTPTEALQKIYDFLNQKVFVDKTRGHYGAQEVIAAAEEMQSALRQRLDKGFPGESITMAGSFPGGRANIRNSDIDVLVSNLSLEQALPQIQQRVNERLRKMRPETNLEVHAMLPVTTIVNAALINPLFVRVTAERIEILVYPPFELREKDEHQLEKNYPPPFIFEVDAFKAFTIPNAS